MGASTIAGQIQNLELSLLQTDLNAHPERINELLAENFEEIDQRGEIHSRDDVIDWLKHRDPNLRWAFKDFRVKVLTSDFVLAIYSLQKPDQPDQPDTGTAGSIRTSLWQRHGNQWKMVFHQASRKN